MANSLLRSVEFMNFGILNALVQLRKQIISHYKHLVKKGYITDIFEFKDDSN